MSSKAANRDPAPDAAVPARCRRWQVLPFALAVLAPALLGAQQSVLRGRVLADSTERPVAGARIEFPQLGLSAVSDSAGRFRIAGIAPGVHALQVRVIGFGPAVTTLAFTGRDSIEAEVVLSATAQPLPTVTVRTPPRLPPKLAEFEARRAEGFGRFITQAELERRESSLTSDILRRVPGLNLIRDAYTGSAYYVAAGRTSAPAGSLRRAGRPDPCFAAVAIDGAFVYTGQSNEPKFDINNVSPGTIAGIEYYAGPASMPAKYNATRGSCGLLLIWTK